MEHAGSAECPQSIILRKPELQRLVQITSGLINSHEQCGATPYGPDLMQWPSKFWEIWQVVSNEQAEVETGMREAMGKERRR